MSLGLFQNRLFIIKSVNSKTYPQAVKMPAISHYFRSFKAVKSHWILFHLEKPFVFPILSNSYPISGFESPKETSFSIYQTGVPKTPKIVLEKPIPNRENISLWRSYFLLHSTD